MEEKLDNAGVIQAPRVSFPSGLFARYWGLPAFEGENETGDAGTVEQEGQGQPEASSNAPVETGEGDHGDGPPSPDQPEETEEQPKKRPWWERRMGQITAQRQEAEQRANHLSQELQRTQAELRRIASGGQQPPQGQQLPGLPPNAIVATREQLQAEAVSLARELAEEESYVNRCNSVFHAGVENFGDDFKSSLKEMIDAFGGELPRPLVEAILETDTPAEVIHKLSKDLDRAYELASMSPTKMAIAVAKMGVKVPAPAKKISNAPAPVKPVVGPGGAKATQGLSDDLPMDQWVREREKQLAARAAQR